MVIILKYLTLDYVKNFVPVRKKSSHKGTYGKVLIIGSSHRYIGAGCICANACMRSGSGLVTLAVENDIFPIVASKMSEVMVLDIDSYKEDFENLVKTCDVIAIGPGLGIRDFSNEKLQYILNKSTSPVIIDADGLNVLAENINFLNTRKNLSTIVLTPHLGEFARLCNCNLADVIKNKDILAVEFAKRYKNIILVLKSDTTIITDGEDSFMCDEGVPQMATGGMGDALCGMITSFVGQSIPILDSCLLAVFTHSYIARKLSNNMNSVLAQDIIEEIPYTLANFRKIKD